MSYFNDLSDYEYCSESRKGTAKNVGWLEQGRMFEVDTPTDETLDLLWKFGAISIMQSRGIHECDLCEPPRTVYAIRKGERRLLGTAEIRVFSKDGQLYAAPTLIYHYVRSHHYRPPNEFLLALVQGPHPPSQEYFHWLKKAGLEWNKTHNPEIARSRFKFENIGGEVKRTEVPNLIYLDES